MESSATATLCEKQEGAGGRGWKNIGGGSGVRSLVDFTKPMRKGGEGGGTEGGVAKRKKTGFDGHKENPS